MWRKALESNPLMSVRHVVSRKHSQFSQWLNFCLLELEEDGVRIALTIVDTPGFGDNIDNEFAYVGYR
jgi:septin family protein